jgi:cell division protein FtsZ
MALMGSGVAEGEHRAVEAAQRAISSPLLEDASIHGARGVLINVTGGEDMTLHEVAEAADIIQDAADPDANIIFGTVVDRALQGRVKVTVIATGFNRVESRKGVGAPASRAATAPPPAPEPEDPAVVRPTTGFLRRGQGDSLDFDAAEDGFTPNFTTKMKSDLDVPAFLRRQMD